MSFSRERNTKIIITPTVLSSSVGLPVVKQLAIVVRNVVAHIKNNGTAAVASNTEWLLRAFTIALQWMSKCSKFHCIFEGISATV